MKQLSVLDHETKPWKNGRGQTSQIAISPKGAAFPEDPFRWRLSQADLEEDSEFSLFPGYQRIFIIWQGAGLFLNEKDLKPLEVLEFAGDATICARLKAGAVRDLGLIYRSDQVRVEMKIYRVPRHTSLQVKSTGDETFIFCAQGNFEVAGFKFTTCETLHLEKSDDEQILRAQNDALLIAVSLIDLK